MRKWYRQFRSRRRLQKALDKEQRTFACILMFHGEECREMGSYWYQRAMRSKRKELLIYKKLSS